MDCQELKELASRQYESVDLDNGDLVYQPELRQKRKRENSFALDSRASKRTQTPCHLQAPDAESGFEGSDHEGPRSGSRPDRVYIFQVAKRFLQECNLKTTFSSLVDEMALIPILQDSEKTQNTKHKGKSRALDTKVPPLSNIDTIFDDFATKALALGLEKACSAFTNNPLRIVTMCSGTESPILALRLLQQANDRKNIPNFNILHLASAEIEPFKQAYIQRNFSPPIIFRDVTEFRKGECRPHTAYGGQADQPKSVHMLIAGSSCVDYSNLNKEPKAFGRAGESYSTMKGVFNYAQNCRPNVIILENVMHAPWTEIEVFWKAADYAVRSIIVDSKNYYVPQTRQRGYLIAFDKRRADVIDFSVEESLARWEELMRKLERKASSPYTDFIHADDDLELENVRRSMALSVRCSDRAADWAACRNRYANFRASEKLGFLRPQTRWQNNGSCTLPDFSWHFWARNQRERIWDTLDINQLRYVSQRGFDMNYKHRCIDLSQNVDRDIDSKSWGIVGCITPSGMPFETRRGGPITGRESLALQGIPVESLILTKESSRQLQDLAGNAMTTTVIGAAIISAMIASTRTRTSGGQPTTDSFFETFPEQHIPFSTEASHHILTAESSHPQTLSNLLAQPGAPKLHLQPQNLGVVNARSVQEILDLANRSRQLCYCEGLQDSKSCAFFICNECGHTVCKLCKGNPCHLFEEIPTDFVENRARPSNFLQAISDALPKSVHFQGTNISISTRGVHSQSLENLDEVFASYVKSALKDCYHFRSIKRDREWRVIYEGSRGRLEFRIVPSLNICEAGPDDILQGSLPRCYWLLFAKCPESVPVDGKWRSLLKDAIAKMVPSEHLLIGRWQIRDLSLTQEVLSVKKIGMACKSWQNKLGLQEGKFRSQTISSKIEIMVKNVTSYTTSPYAKSVSGEYQLLSDCGTAGGTLYRKKSTGEEDQTLFLFLDPEPLQDSLKDCFVFAFEHNRRSSHDHRHLLAKLSHEWRPTDTALIQDVDCTFMCEWGDEDGLKLIENSSESEAQVWTPYSLQDVTIPDRPCATSDAVLLLAKIPLSQDQKRYWRDGKAYDLDIVERPETMQTLLWLLKSVTTLPYVGPWQTIAVTQPMHSRCESCSPSAPILTWKWTLKRCSKKLIVMPFEDSRDADLLEEKLKARPSPLLATLHCANEQSILEIRLNLATLVHRTLAILIFREHTATPPLNFDLRWRITKYESFAAIPTLGTIKLQSNISDSPWPLKTDTGCDMTTWGEWQLPPNFKRKLWVSQRRTLTWMHRQELGVTEWWEQECSEISLPVMNIQIEVKASFERRIPSGILADEVGGGKTTTALALIATDLPALQDSYVKGSSNASRRIRSNATLILVPKNIMLQWKREFRKCFTNCERILTAIPSVQTFKTLGLAEIKGAKVILASWDLFDSSGYWSLMRRLCCAPNVPPQPGRAFQQWLDESLDDLGDLIQLSTECDDLEKFWTEREAKKQKVKKYEKFDAFKREKGSGNDDDKGEESDQKTSEDLISPVTSTLTAPKHLSAESVEYQGAHPSPLEKAEGLDADFWRDIENWSGGKQVYPLLHMFSFRRIIVDEFTYLEGRSLPAILTLEGTYRWMLSGTPSLGDFEGINTMAKLLNTRISNIEEYHGSFSFGKNGPKKRKEQTYAEEFHYYSAAVSPGSLLTRYQLAHKFGQGFIRQNPTDLRGTSRIDHFLVIPPSAVEYATYFEVYLPLTSQSFRFGKKFSPKELKAMDRRTRLRAAITQSDCAEQALLSCFSEMRGEWSFQDLVDDLHTPSMEILAMKEEEFGGTVEALLKELKETFWYRNQKADKIQDNPHFSKFLQSVTNGGNIGDLTISHLIDCLLYDAVKQPTKPNDLRINEEKRAVWKIKVEKAQHDYEKQKQRYDTAQLKLSKKPDGKNVASLAKVKNPEGLKIVKDPGYIKFDDKSITIRRTEMVARTRELNTLSLRLVEQAKSLRFFHAVAQIATGQPHFNCSYCYLQSAYESSYILGLCGHVVCKSCFHDDSRSIEDQGACPQSGCTTIPLPHHLIPASAFAATHTSHHTKVGSKMDAVTDTIRRINPQEYILIFVQYPVVKDHLTEALEDAGILFEDACKMTRQRVSRFKNAAKKACQSIPSSSIGSDESSDDGETAKQKPYVGSNPHVLILMLDSPDSAGWNLQVVNHVMFISPLVAKSQYYYDSIMTQAIGRALRFGQKKPVHVYHFATARTLEVNILEERTKKVVVKRSDRFELVLPEEVTDEDEAGWVGPGLQVEEGEGGEEEDDAEQDGHQ